MSDLPPQPSDATPGRAARRGVMFAIVVTAIFVSAVDQTAVVTALPTIQREFDTGIEWSGWTITVYALGQVLVMPLAGRLSALYGRKRVFLVAACVFAAASLCCGLAPNIQTLVALRAVQAIGGGSFIPSASGIIAEHFGQNRDRALGMFTSVFQIGGVLGPVIGGFIVGHWSWRFIFMINVPILLAVIVLGAIFLPRGRRPPGRRVDGLGIILLGASVLSIMVGLTLFGDSSTTFTDPAFVIAVVGAVVLVALFLLRMRFATAPFVPLWLLRGNGFGVMNALNFFHGAAALGIGLLIPSYAQLRFGTSPWEAGGLLSARALAVVCTAGIAVFLLRRIGHRIPLVLGSLIVAGGMTAVGLTPADVPSSLWLAAAGALAGIGIGMVIPASNNAIMQLSPDHASDIAGIRGMFRQLGSITAISVATAVTARSDDPAGALGAVFLAFAALMIAALPLVLFVPEHRGRW